MEIASEVILVNLEVINEDIVRGYLQVEKLSTEGTKVELIGRLFRFYGDLYKKKVAMAGCDNCGCPGPAELVECPFCGDTSEVQAAIVTEEDPRNELEAACAIVRDGVQTATQSLYNVGKALIRIVDDRLWEQQIGEDGESLYRGPYPCIEAMCGMKTSAAHNLVRIAREYDAKMFAEHGSTALRVSLLLPSKSRPRFLEKAKTMPKRGPELRGLAREMVEEAEKPEIADAPATPPVRIHPKAPSTSRVRVRLGVTAIPMHRRPRVRDEHLEPSRSIRDYPWCDVHLGGDTFLGIRITKNLEGEIIAMVEFREVQKSSGSGTLTVKG